jgi:hypothetical protein
MSSEISTKSKRKRGTGKPANGGRAAAAPVSSAGADGLAQPAARGGVQPWHLFVLGGLVASTGSALAVHGTTPINIIFTCLAVMTAASAGYGVYRTFAPLVSNQVADGSEMVGGRTRGALEREKFLVLRAIKDLEFDRAMGKVSEGDCQEMIARLRARAVRLIRQLDCGAAGYRELIEREVSARLGLPASALASPPPTPTAAPAPMIASSRSATRCPRCQTDNDVDARFCKRCGASLEGLS